MVRSLRIMGKKTVDGYCDVWRYALLSLCTFMVISLSQEGLKLLHFVEVYLTLSTHGESTSLSRNLGELLL
jgi:hypothetical protein